MRFYNQYRIVAQLQIFLQYSGFTSPDGAGILSFYAKLNQHIAYVIPNVNALTGTRQWLIRMS